MGSRKKQDHLSKLEAWGPWNKVEGEKRERGGSREIFTQLKGMVSILPR